MRSRERKVVRLLVCMLALVLSLPAFAADAPKESVFDRVVRTGTLRCGYNFWEPGLVYDEKKQHLWGFYYDVMQEFEKESGINQGRVGPRRGLGTSEARTGRTSYRRHVRHVEYKP